MKGKRFMALAVALLALNAFFWVARSGVAAGLGGIGDFFFGPRMVRAEVLVAENGGTSDYFVDRGIVRAVGSGSVTIQEANGDVRTLQIAPTAQVTGAVHSVFQIRKRMRVTLIRIGDTPATRVVVTLK